MNKKTLFLLAALLTLTLALSGCISTTPAVNDYTAAPVDQGTVVSNDRLSAIKQAGKLVLGTESGYPPFEFQIVKDGKVEVVGFDIDIAREIAKDMGVELVIQDMDFDGLPTAVQQGAVDLAIAGMNPTEERKEAIDFSNSYYDATHSVIVRKGEGANYPNVEAFSGKTVGAQKGATQEALALGAFADAGAKNVILPRVDTLILELKSNRVDGVIVETVVSQVHTRADATLEVAPFVIDDPDIGSVAVGIQKGNPELLAAVNATLKRLGDEGKLEEYFAAAQTLAAENEDE